MAKKRSEYIKATEVSMQVQESLVEYRLTKPGKLNNVPGQNKGLNAAQLYFLQLLRFVKTEGELNELRQIVSDFYLKKLQKEADKLWDEGKLGDFLLNEHLRTPYKY